MFFTWYITQNLEERMAVERSSVSPQDRWNVEILFHDLTTWQKSFDDCHKKEKPHWPEMLPYKGKLSDPAMHKKFLETFSKELFRLKHLCSGF